MEKFNHIGVVVNDIDEAVKNYIKLNPNYREISREIVENDLSEISIICDGDYAIEFVRPINEKSPVYNFLKKGGGIHHICYSTDSIDEYFQRNKENIRVIKNKHVGFFGYTIAFFVQRDFSSGIQLYELVEDDGKLIELYGVKKHE